MEPKKNPRYDVHRKRGLIYNISLSISILLVLGLLKVPIRAHRIGDVPLPYNEPELKYTRDPLPYLKKKEELPKHLKEPSLNPKTRLVNLVPVESEPDETTDLKPLDMTDDPDEWSLDLSGVSEEKPENNTFIVVEDMPEPIGGWEVFYGTIQKNLHYPKAAIRNQVQGKVFVQFVVNEKGEVVELSVLKGIGSGCDEEALRVLSLPKWRAGKQRGRPVRVQMAQAINFQLN